MHEPHHVQALDDIEDLVRNHLLKEIMSSPSAELSQSPTTV